MRYDDDTYLSDEADNDLWDDELQLSSEDSEQGANNIRQQPYMPEHSYSPYRSDEGYDNDGDAETGDNDDNAENAENDYYSDSDSQPEASRRRRLRGLFRKKDEEEEEDTEESDDEEDDGAYEQDDDNDYYDSVAPTRRPKAPKVPKLDPEDPDYWIVEEESPLKEIMPGPVKKWKWMLAAALTFLIIILFAWIWFLRPYTDSAVKYGYIKNMERRGWLIKTFEGAMIPYKELGDPDPFYFEEMRFSVESDSLAAKMKRMMLGCVPVRVEYEMYHVPLPWKGEEKMIIIKADTADPRKILPPEYRRND